MLNLFYSAGPWAWPLTAMAVAIAALSIRKIVQIFITKETDPARLERGLHAILFWGILSAVTGILGQISGIYHALNIIIHASEISPQVIAIGLTESFTTTLFGLFVLVISSIVWFTLYRQYRKILSMAEHI